MRGALAELRALIADGISPANTATEMDEEGARLLFQSGRAVFMRNWPYAAALLESKDSKLRGKVWVSPLPGSFGALGGWQLGLRKGTPLAKEAARFAAFLASHETQLRLAKNLGWNPSRLGVYEDLKGPSAPPHLDALRAALRGAVGRPRMKGYAAFSEKAYQATSKVLLGLQSPEDAAKELSRP
jgi:multiple sugar transport system substrate-binding protein